jgi:hypothetical protein
MSPLNSKSDTTKKHIMKHQRYNSPSGTGRAISELVSLNHGSLLIPDISGFTKFVHDTDIGTGKYVISRLLTVLLDCNILGLKVSEIEGDAILFYKLGKRLSSEEVLIQFSIMQHRFSAELSKLSRETGIELKLSLKMIAHYGPLTEYQVGRFTKLYGTSVIEVHRLLKNSIASDEYLIITDNLLNSEPLLDDRIGFANRICETYNHLESICFTWLRIIPEYHPKSLVAV